jgi:tetratricopeptide (TPR) repeat protein
MPHWPKRSVSIIGASRSCRVRKDRSIGPGRRTTECSESGTGKLEEAAFAFREALKEFTREHAPLQWAGTQINLGSALGSLGERVSGTEKLDEAILAFREALKEWTRERAPLDWAGTQINLGIALRKLGERERGTERLEAAVEAYIARR